MFARLLLRHSALSVLLSLSTFEARDLRVSYSYPAVFPCKSSTNKAQDQKESLEDATHDVIGRSTFEFASARSYIQQQHCCSQRY